MNEIGRRKLLRSAAGLASVAALGSTAGCLDSVPFVGGSSGAVNAVPDSSDALMYANVDTIREDEGVKTLTNTYLEQRASYGGGDELEDYEDVLELIEDEYDIDPAQVHEVTAFTEYGDQLASDYGGAIVKAELSAEEFKDAIEEWDNINFEESERSGSVVYEPEEEGGPWVGTLGSNQVVIGTEDAVKDAMDVSNGDDDALGGDLKSAYDNARDAPVKFAADVPDPEDYSSLPEEDEGGDSIDFGPIADVETLSGAVYKNGDARGLEVTLNATDNDAAEDVEEMLNDVKDEIEGSVSGTAEDILDDISIERNGSSVTVSVEKTISELEDIIEGE